jgi:beta-lysine N6-acetyltransferase
MSIADAYYLIRMESGNYWTLHACLDFFNKRLRVDDYSGNLDALLSRVNEIALEHAFTKVFVKTRKDDWPYLLSRGYMLEGIYRGYFLGEDAYCMAMYFDLERRTSDYWIEEDGILAQVLGLPVKQEQPTVPIGCTLRLATAGDGVRLAALYIANFHTYPTPMNESAYIAKMMEEGTIFYLVEESGQLISAASAEINAFYRNAEMTDCVTMPKHRGKGLMRLLIHALEGELIARGITCAYSLSRALSYGMNAVFKQTGYQYSGRMTKNCDIYDKFEDMNLWVKDLKRQ